jgi:RNase P/RNase MRP subunit p30
MSPSAIVFPDSRINKKALEQMKEREIALCIQLSNLTMSYGLQRSRNLYMASKLFDYAKGMEIDVCFASFARTNVQLCSYIQIIELARLLGADEEYAKKSLSMNGSLAIE